MKDVISSHVLLTHITEGHVRGPYPTIKFSVLIDRAYYSTFFNKLQEKYIMKIVIGFDDNNAFVWVFDI